MLDISLEAISFRGNSLFERLTQIVHFLRADKSYSTQAINESLIDKIIFKETGLNVRFGISQDLYSNAWMVFPDIKTDHTLNYLGKTTNEYANGTRTGHMLLNMSKQMPRGSINLKTGKVGGFYSTVIIDIRVTMGLLNNTTLNDDEVAAVILHELGHAFTYFEYLHVVAFGGSILQAAAKDLAGVPDARSRQDIIKTASDMVGIEISDEGILNNQIATEHVEAVLVKNYLTTFYSATGNVLYDIRTAEQIADQFAVRHGAGRAFASAMAKAFGGLTRKKNEVVYIALESMKVLLLLSPVGWPTIMLGLIGYSLPVHYSNALYDKPYTRLEMLKRYLIENLKDIKREGSDDKFIAQVVEDIEAINLMLDNYEERDDIIHLLFTSLPSSRNKLRNQERAANELNKLINNDLTYQAARFENFVKGVKD